MGTEIGYLRELKEDLLTVAWRESLPAARRRRARRPRSRGKLVALISAAALVLSGVTGYVALRITNYPLRILFSAPPALRAPAQRGGEQGIAFGFATAVPSPSPANGPALPGTIVPGDLTRVVKTAELSLVVGKGTFGDSFDAASRVAEKYGGFVESSSTQGGKSGRLLIRIPAARFDAALHDLKALGRVEGESVTGTDVTAQFVDLGARLRISRARRAVLLQLMGKATTIESTIRVQNALDDVQLRMEELIGQIHLLQNQTDKATIRVNIRESGVPVAQPQEKVTNPSLGSAWRHSIAGFFAVLFAVVVGLGYLVPAAILLALGWFLYRRVRAREA